MESAERNLKDSTLLMLVSNMIKGEDTQNKVNKFINQYYRNPEDIKRARGIIQDLKNNYKIEKSYQIKVTRNLN